MSASTTDPVPFEVKVLGLIGGMYIFMEVAMFLATVYHYT